MNFERMMKILTKAATGLAATLMLASVPAQASPMLIAFNIASGGANTYTSTGGSLQIAQLAYNATDINIPSGDYLTVSFTISNPANLSTGSAGTLTITNGATSDFAGVSAGATLYQSAADFSIAGTDGAPSSSLNVTVADNTPVAFNATFWGDVKTSLGLPVNAMNDLTLSGGITGSDIAGSDKILSDTIGFTPQTSGTPEPSSLLLFSAAILAGAAAKRKRIFSLL